MISLTSVIGSAVKLSALNNFRNQDIRISVAVTVSVGGEIIRHEISANRDVLSDGLAVISSYARSKILWRFDPAGRRFGRVSGNRNRRAGSAGVGIKQVLTDKDFFSRIGREHV